MPARVAEVLRLVRVGDDICVPIAQRCQQIL